MDDVEPLITQLVQQAPALDPSLIAELLIALRVDGSPLAHSIARVVELVGEQLVDAGIALPALAMACASLAEADPNAATREAARFEIETLLPVPDGPPMRVVMPDARDATGREIDRPSPIVVVDEPSPSPSTSTSTSTSTWSLTATATIL